MLLGTLSTNDMIPLSDHASDSCLSENLPVLESPQSSTSVEHSTTERFCDDIGEIFVNTGSPTKFTATMQSLIAAQKYSLPTKHKMPRKDQIFPTKYIGGCNCSFRYIWLEENLWMAYSEEVDSVFCIPCSIFCLDSAKGSFVSKPFSIWNKKSEKTKEHTHSLYHQKSMEQADNLKQSIEHPHTTIISHLDACKAANIECNHSVLKSMARAVLFCGRQCIALRGDSEHLESPGNSGNFLALLKLLAVHNSVLQSHLQAPSMRCATYMSPQTQNELIEVVGKHIILQGIVDKVNASPFYSILADEVASYNVEHLAICIRFLDHKQDIRKEFLTFPIFRANHR